MHCPDHISGSEYIGLVAAVSLLLSRDLNARETFILAEFLDAVSDQLCTLAAFKDLEKRRPPFPPVPGQKDSAAHRAPPPGHPGASAGPAPPPNRT